MTESATIGGVNTPERITAAERQRRALDLRKQGRSYQAIADELRYAGPTGAHKAIASALKHLLQEPAEDVRRLEVERLDALMASRWEAALEGDNAALDRILSIMARRARLLGLDAPAQIDLELRIRQEAVRSGVDPDEAVQAAQEVIREHQARTR